ncbi:MAG: T9SS type A sorting domain-containing protein [Bacteroidia bacterium]
MIKNFTKAFSILSLAGALSANAQQFQVSQDLTGDDYGNRILVNGSSVNIVGATSATGAGSYDMMVEDLSTSGAHQGGGQLGGTGSETARAVGLFTDGSVAIGGASNTLAPVLGLDDAMILKLDNTGSPDFYTVLGTDSVDRVFEIGEGNDASIIAAGQYSRSIGSNKSDGLVAKLDASTGAVTWAKTIGFQFSNEVIYDFLAINGVGYAAVGYTGVNVIGVNDNLFFLLNEDGTKNTCFVFGGPGDDDARSIIDAGSGVLYVAGNSRNIGQGSGEAFLARFDVSAFPTIVLDWYKTYGETGSESLQRAIYDPTSGGVLMVGTTSSFGNGDEGFAVMVDANGVIQWSKVYGGAGSDYFQDVALDGSGGFYLSGYSNSFGGTQNNLWLVRTDANGASLCNESNAAFVENTISNTIAYAVFSNTALNDIVSTDVALTARNVTAFAFNQNTPAENVLCTTIGVQEVSSSAVSVYPNPAGATLNFNFGVNAADAKGLIIYNSVGAKVYETTLSNVTSVFSADISNLANGMYTAVVFMNDTQVTAKFTVAK